MSFLNTTGDSMLPKRHPREGGKALPNWQVEMVPSGDGFAAWKTGDCFWCETHHLGVSSPCRQAMTDGALGCPRDHGRYPLRWLGYLPLIRETGQAVCVVVQGYSAEQIDALKIGDEVIVKRDRGRNKPVMVSAQPHRRPFKGIESRLVESFYFDAWLLKMWGDAVLASHFGVRGVTHKRGDAPGDNEVSLAEADPLPRAKVVEAPDKRLVGEVLNGFHRKPR